jgi:hypothetical protein
MASFLGSSRMICCALTLALVIACATGLAGAAPSSPPATTREGGQQRPNPLSKIPGPAPTTAPDMLMLADALVRGGHVLEARLMLQQVIDQFAGQGWAKWGALGIGFLELARGHFDEARPYYEAAATPGFSQDTAMVVLALLDAQAGNTDAAAATLDSLAVNASVRQPVRDAASGRRRVTSATGRGDYEGAAVAFAVLPDNNSSSPLADDALYGLARSFQRSAITRPPRRLLRAHQRDAAQGFDDTARATCPAPAPNFREILRATGSATATCPIGQPEQMLIALARRERTRAREREPWPRSRSSRSERPKGSTIAVAAGDAKATSGAEAWCTSPPTRRWDPLRPAIATRMPP